MLVDQVVVPSCMVGHPVQNDIHAMSVGRGDKLLKIGQGPEFRIDPVVVFDGVRAAQIAFAMFLADFVTFPLSADQHCGLVDKKKLKEICFEIPRRRIEGYLEVLEDGGAGSSAIVWECLRANEESGRNAMEGILQTGPRPTAILATSDRLAIGVIEARRHLLRVPEDLAVVGFDDIPAAQLITPQLTTIHQPMTEKGRLAVSLLLKEKVVLRNKLAAKLIIRQSSDPSIAASG
jgi:DNA-binding LacI/PurR family transcriptional regulator